MKNVQGFNVRRQGTLFAAVAAVCLAGACRGAASSAPKPVTADVWAVVDDRQITKGDVEKAYRGAVQPTPTPPSDDEVLSVKLNIVDGLITQELLLARARALGIEATDGEVEAQFAERRRGMSDEAFQKQLSDTGMTTDDVKAGLKREMSVQKVLDREVTARINVTDQDITTFFNQNRAQFNLTEPQYRLAQIVVTPARDPQLQNRMNDDAATPAEAQRKVDMLNQRLRTGGEFSSLAMDYSEDPQSVAQGGDLGFVPGSALGRVSPALKDAVQKMQPNTVTTVSIGPNYFILMMLARQAAGQQELTTPAVRDGIRDMLHDRKEQLLRTAYLTSVHDNAKVVNYLARQVVDAQSAAKPPTMTPAAPAK